MPDLSTILRTDAEARSLTQTQIAESAAARGHAIRQSHVQAVLSGTTADPRLSTLTAILSGMGRSLSWLDRRISGRGKNQKSG